MEQFYYFQLMRKITIQFLDTLNNIRIAKYNPNGSIIKYIDVPLKLSSKQKYYYWLKDRSHVKNFPMMAASLNSMTYNPSRKNNRKIKIKIDETQYHYNTTPYDMTFEVIISATYANEIFQIIEQIIPFFDPYIMIKLNVPEIDNTFDVKIILESVSMDDQQETGEDEYKVENWNLSFLVQGEFLRPIEERKLVKDIILQFKDYDLYDTELISGSGLYETIYLSGGYNEEVEKIYNYEIFDDFNDYKDGIE